MIILVAGIVQSVMAQFVVFWWWRLCIDWENQMGAVYCFCEDFAFLIGRSLCERVIIDFCQLLDKQKYVVEWHRVSKMMLQQQK